MKRKERQRTFHDALLNMLYAPSSSPPRQNQIDEQTLNFAREIANSDHHHINTDELKGEVERRLLASSDEHDELGFQKLTRAQRKRLRKKKIKEAASHRRQIIGPQLPSASNDQIGCQVSDFPEHQLSEGVRRNAAERPESGNDYDHKEETSTCIKVKHRRISKKKARGKQKRPPTDYSHEATKSGDQN